MSRPFQLNHKCWTGYLDRDLWHTFEKTLTLIITFFLWDKVFIFGMCVLYDKAFLLVPYILNVCPWPWPLTFFSKTLTLAVSLLSLEIGFSYLAYVFLIYPDLYNGAIYFKHVNWTGNFDFCKTWTLPPQTYTMSCAVLHDFVSMLVKFGF